MAFPTTGLLDAFNRANENPLTGALGSGPIIPAAPRLQIVTNQVTSVGATGSAYTGTSYGPDAEAFCTVAVKPTNTNAINLALRLVTPNTASWKGYWLSVKAQAGTDTWEIYRVDNGTFTLLGSTVTGPEFTAGDKIGFQATGSTLTGFAFQASAWSQIIQRSDATYGAAGPIGVQIDDTTGAIDDFSGGTVVVSAGGVLLNDPNFTQTLLRSC